MHKMNHWAHRLYPKLPFDATLDVLANRLGNKKVVTTHVKKIRMGMVTAEVRAAEGPDPGSGDEHGEVARYDGGDEGEGRGEEQGDMFRQLVEAGPASQPRSKELNEEQMERMRRNKELAAQRKREREEQRRREQEEDELMREMEVKIHN